MAEPSSHMWYVKAAGGVWGPYPEARVAGFVAEGRVSPATLLSPWAGGPFAPAQASVEFEPLFRSQVEARTGTDDRPAGRPSARQAAAPQPIPAPVADRLATPPSPVAESVRALVADPSAVAAGSGPVRPLLVWIDHAQTSLELTAVLDAFGPNIAIRPGLWLVRARTPAATLRNLLSRKLGEHDALLVVEATLDQAAWFNLDPARDRELRRLWSSATQK